MRPSQFHYIKRMWVRNSYKKSSNSGCFGLMLYSFLLLILLGTLFSGIALVIIAIVVITILSKLITVVVKKKDYRIVMIYTIVIFIIWSLYICLNIPNILTQIKPLEGGIIYIFGVLLFCGPTYTLYRIWKKRATTFSKPTQVCKDGPILPSEEYSNTLESIIHQCDTDSSINDEFNIKEDEIPLTTSCKDINISYAKDYTKAFENSIDNGAWKRIELKGLDNYIVNAGIIVIDTDRAAIGVIMRRLKIGFNRAASIMNQLELLGVVDEEIGTRPRNILVTMETFKEIILQNQDHDFTNDIHNEVNYRNTNQEHGFDVDRYAAMCNAYLEHQDEMEQYKQIYEELNTDTTD